MASRSLKVGIIGAGWVASARHIPCFQRVAGVEVVAVLDHHADRARDAADSFKIAQPCSDPEQFFASDLDIVAICTPPQTHASLTIEALERKCHVFVEKPMAMSEAEARGMIDAAERNSRLLCVSHNLLFSRSMQKVRRMMARGELGEVRQVLGVQLSSPSRRLPAWYPDLPGGLFFDEAAHLVYLMRHFLGNVKLEHVSLCQGESFEQPVRSVYAKLEGTSADGVLSMCFDSPVSEWLLCVVGSRRVIVFDVFRDILTSLRADGAHTGQEILKNTLLTSTDFARGFLTSGFLHSTKKLFYGHERLIERFVESVRHGGDSPVAGTEGVQVVSIMEQLLSLRDPASSEVAR